MHAGRASWLAAPCAHGVPERTLSIAKKIGAGAAALTSLKEAAEHPGDVIAQVRLQDQSGTRQRRSSGRVLAVPAVPSAYGGAGGASIPSCSRPSAPGSARSVAVDMFKGTSGRMRNQDRPDLARDTGRVWCGRRRTTARCLLGTKWRGFGAKHSEMITNAPSTLGREAAMQLVRNAEDCASNIQCMIW